MINIKSENAFINEIKKIKIRYYKKKNSAKLMAHTNMKNDDNREG